MIEPDNENVRLMRWKAGTGYIATGGGESIKTDKDNRTVGKTLPAKQAVAVYDTKFKISKT
jgi:hypothetical protein